MWDSTKHFRTPLQDEFSVNEILAQTLDNDPKWTKEIPEGSFVAIHTLPNAYTTRNGTYRNIGLNVIGVQILVIPRAARA